MVLLILLLIFLAYGQDLVDIASLRPEDLTCPDESICFSARPSPSSPDDTLQLSILVSRNQGWGAIGWGNGAEMRETTMVIFYPSDDGVTVSPRYAPEENIPIPVPESFVNVLETGTNEFGYGAHVEIKKGQEAVEDFETNGRQVFIWATGEDRPENGDVDARFGIHDQKGAVEMSISPAEKTSEESTLKPIAELQQSDLQCPDPSICIGARPAPSSSKDSLELSILVSRQQGWGAVGFGNGQEMVDSTMFILSAQQENVTVSHRFAQTMLMPEYVPDSSIEVLDTGRNDFGYGAHLRVKNGQTGIQSFTTDGEQVFIWAFAEEPPRGPEPDAGFDIHDSKGNIKFSLSSASDSPAPPAVVESSGVAAQVIIHGVLMSVAWLVLCPVAIIIARFFKAALGVWWFRLHMLLMLSVLILQFTSFGIIFQKSEGRHLTQGWHAWLGVLVLGLSSMQTILGFVVDRLFDPNRQGIPLHDKLHWWLGRVTFIVAVVTIGWGMWLAELSALWYGVAGGVIGLMSVAAFILQFRLGQQHHVDGKLGEKLGESS